MTDMYKEEIMGFQRHLDLHNSILMPMEEDGYEVCKELSGIHTEKYGGKPFEFREVKSLFLGQIFILGDKTKIYYDKRVPRIKIDRTNEFRNGSAEIVGYPGKQRMYVTKKPFTDVDFIAVSHEYGHVPTLDNPVKNGKEYFDYLEVLPMYFEYLACTTIDKEHAKELFLKLRLDDMKNEANLYLCANRKIKGNGSNADTMHECYKRDIYKYIKSLEYTLQLIERADNNQSLVNSLLDEVVVGDLSIKDMRTYLEIDTEGCKKLLKNTTKK